MLSALEFTAILQPSEEINELDSSCFLTLGPMMFAENLDDNQLIVLVGRSSVLLLRDSDLV